MHWALRGGMPEGWEEGVPHPPTPNPVCTFQLQEAAAQAVRHRTQGILGIIVL